MHSVQKTQLLSAVSEGSPLQDCLCKTETSHNNNIMGTWRAWHMMAVSAYTLFYTYMSSDNRESHIHTHTLTHALTHARTHTHTHTHTHTRTHARTQTHTHTRASARNPQTNKQTVTTSKTNHPSICQDQKHMSDTVCQGTKTHVWYRLSRHKNTCLIPTYRYSAHHGNLLKSFVTTSRITYFIPRAHTGKWLSQNYVKQ